MRYFGFFLALKPMGRYEYPLVGPLTIFALKAAKSLFLKMRHGAPPFVAAGSQYEGNTPDSAYLRIVIFDLIPKKSIACLVVIFSLFIIRAYTMHTPQKKVLDTSVSLVYAYVKR